MSDAKNIEDNDLTEFLNRIQGMKQTNQMTLDNLTPLNIKNIEPNDLLVGGVKSQSLSMTLPEANISNHALKKYNISEPKFDKFLIDQSKKDTFPILKKEIVTEPVIDPTQMPRVVPKTEWVDTQPFEKPHSPVILLGQKDLTNLTPIKENKEALNEWADTQPVEQSIEPKKNVTYFLSSISNMAKSLFDRKKTSDIKINTDNTNGQEFINENQNHLKAFGKSRGVRVIFDKIQAMTQSISLSGAEKDVIFVQEHFKDALNMIGLTDVNQSIKKSNEEMRISVAKRINSEFQFPLDNDHNLNFGYLGKLDDKSKFEFISKVLLPKISSLIKENVHLSFHINKLTHNNKELSLLNKFAEFNNFDNIDLVFTLLKETPEILKEKPGYEKIIENRVDIIEKYEKYNNLNENNMSALKELQQMITDIKSTVSKMNIAAEDKKTLFKNFDEELALNEVFQKGKKVSTLKVTIGDSLKNIDSIREGAEQSRGIKIKMS